MNQFCYFWLMDRKLKAILDEFLPYVDDEKMLGAESAARRQKKYEQRKRLAEMIEIYKQQPDLNLSIEIDMTEVLKRMKSDN